MQITSEPATIAVSINHDNYTNSCIEKTGKFAISILSETTNPELIGTFGFQSGKNINKFETVEAVVKGKSPKNAPRYIAEDEKQTKAAKWVCGFCGYEYDGEVPFEELPEDFTCPLCKQPKSVFNYLFI